MLPSFGGWRLGDSARSRFTPGTSPPSLGGNLIIIIPFLTYFVFEAAADNYFFVWPDVRSVGEPAKAAWGRRAFEIQSLEIPRPR